MYNYDLRVNVFVIVIFFLNGEKKEENIARVERNAARNTLLVRRSAITTDAYGYSTGKLFICFSERNKNNKKPFSTVCVEVIGKRKMLSKVIEFKSMRKECDPRSENQVIMSHLLPSFCDDESESGDTKSFPMPRRR